MKYWNKIIITASAGAAFLFWFLFKLRGLPSVTSALLSTAIDSAVVATAILFTNYQLLPKLLYTRKYKTFACYFVILVFVFGSVLLFSNLRFQWSFLQLNDHRSYWLWNSLFFSSYLLIFFSCSTGASIRFAIDRLTREKELERLKRDKVEAELSFLKGQVNPHFLFNSLNSIYYQIDKTNIDARETLTRFSDLLRYQLYNVETQEIDLSKEVQFLKNYIELQRIRMNSNHKIEYVEEGEMNGYRIAPLLLIPLVENCFKYVSHYQDRINLISFSIKRTNGSLCFCAINTSERSKKQNDLSEKGIGLANVKRRLELLYPNKHDFIVNQYDNSFEVRLKIETL